MRDTPAPFLRADRARLWLRFALILGALCAITLMACAVAYKLAAPYTMGFPPHFFQAIAAAMLGSVIGTSLLEWRRLSQGGSQRMAPWLGGTDLTEDPDDVLQRRLLNLTDELADAQGIVVQGAYVLPHETSVNLFVMCGHRRDLAVCATQGALTMLTRAELRALLAHGLSRLGTLDSTLLRERLAMIWSLAWLHAHGQGLMSPVDGRKVGTLRWLLGLALRGLGWPGWIGSRMLQSQGTRQAVITADADTCDLTQDKLELSNVLRKVLYAHNLMQGRMLHPSADLMAFLAFQDPMEMPGLATHPTLDERIVRVAGIPLPGLPTSAQGSDDTEPRRADRDDASDDLAPLQEMATAAAPIKVVSEHEALERLRDRDSPTDTRMAILALMHNPDNARERKLWNRLAEDAAGADIILQDVLSLRPTTRLPEFERLVSLAAGQPLIHKRMLVESARDLMRADGRVSPRERLWWLVLRHRLQDPHHSPQMRPITGQGQTLADLSLIEKAYVSTLSAYVARFIPEDSPPGLIGQRGQGWWSAIQARLGQGDDTPPGKAPDTDALMHALSGVQELSWMVRPHLLMAWTEEAFNHSPMGVLSNDTADALRLLASLLDAQLPPLLASHYPKAA